MRDSRGRGESGLGHLAPALDRRGFLAAAAAAAAVWLLPGGGRAAPPAFAPGGALLAALEASPFVYVSPLRKGGAESSCHAEVWFAWLDGAVVIVTASAGWKARAVAAGDGRARLWVGDYGRWKGAFGRNEAFRAAPSFVARAAATRDPALLDRLVAAYEKKYPDEIGRWRDRFRAGVASGERVLLRYVPESA